MQSTVRVGTSQDLPRIKQMAKDNNYRITTLPDITFVAEEDGKVVGVIGFRMRDKDFPLLDPLYMAEATSPKRTAYRLVHALEHWIRESVGEGQFRYVFGVKRNQTEWNGLVCTLADKYAETDERNWYMREVPAHGEGKRAK